MLTSWKTKTFQKVTRACLPVIASNCALIREIREPRLPFAGLTYSVAIIIIACMHIE